MPTRRSKATTAPPPGLGAAEDVVAPPPLEVQTALRAHAVEVHSRDFDLDRDVYFAGNQRAGTVFDWQAATAAGPGRFWCIDCPGRVFVVGQVAYGTPERNAYLRAFDPNVRLLLGAAPAEVHDALIEAYDRGDLGTALIAASDARRRQRTAVRNSPPIRRRLAGFRTYFFAAYERLGTVDAAIDSLVELHATDIDAYREVLGTDRSYQPETMRQWMQRTTTAQERRAAKERFLARAELERAERLAAARTARQSTG